MARFALSRLVTGSFLVTLMLQILTIGASPTPAHAQTVLAAHPRVWLTPARIARLRSYAVRNTARWQSTKSWADSMLLASWGDNAETIPVLGLAYQVTQNPAYALRAITIMTDLAVPTDTLTVNSYYDFRYTIPDMSAGLDWCYDQMTVAQRQQVAGWLMDRAYDVWPDTNASRVTGWGVWDASNNYYWGFMMTWPAALAAYDDDPRAPGELQQALGKWTSMVRPFTDNWGTGGNLR